METSQPKCTFSVHRTIIENMHAWYLLNLNGPPWRTVQLRLHWAQT